MHKYIIFELQKIKKKKDFKETRRKKHLTYRVARIKITSDFSSNHVCMRKES